MAGTTSPGDGSINALILQALVRKCVAKNVLTVDDVKAILFDAATRLDIEGSRQTPQAAKIIVDEDLAPAFPGNHPTLSEGALLDILDGCGRSGLSCKYDRDTDGRRRRWCLNSAWAVAGISGPVGLRHAFRSASVFASRWRRLALCFEIIAARAGVGRDLYV
ncbi:MULTISPECIES: hypothetical protein [Bradyrhizobium]|uniref:hypothetical protein n=1 Tax=Bradyrhizobium TaxID=374 RepID=UPI001FEF8248|nr:MULTISPECIES: hypothetical protein [Bradyrhizobium]